MYKFILTLLILITSNQALALLATPVGVTSAPLLTPTGASVGVVAKFPSPLTNKSVYLKSIGIIPKAKLINKWQALNPLKLTPGGIALTAALIAAGYLLDEETGDFNTINSGYGEYYIQVFSPPNRGASREAACDSYLIQYNATYGDYHTSLGVQNQSGNYVCVLQYSHPSYGTYQCCEAGITHDINYVYPPEALSPITDQQMYDAVNDWYNDPATSPYSSAGLFQNDDGSFDMDLIDPIDIPASQASLAEMAGWVQAGIAQSTDPSAPFYIDPAVQQDVNDWIAANSPDPASIPDPATQQETLTAAEVQNAVEQAMAEQAAKEKAEAEVATLPATPVFEVPEDKVADWDNTSVFVDFKNTVMGLFPFSLLNNPLSSFTSSSNLPELSITVSGHTVSSSMNMWDEIFTLVRAVMGMLLIFGFYMSMTKMVTRV